jgi:hypothetical protein
MSADADADGVAHFPPMRGALRCCGLKPVSAAMLILIPLHASQWEGPNDSAHWRDLLWPDVHFVAPVVPFFAVSTAEHGTGVTVVHCDQ